MVQKRVTPTRFLLARPFLWENQSQTIQLECIMYYVLITAAHVLEGIDGQRAILTLRQKLDDGSYSQKFWNVQIRDSNDKPLYVKHENADVVALYVDCLLYTSRCV